MIKNKIFSSGTVIPLAIGESYTLKDNEVFINNVIYRKEDLEITFKNSHIQNDSNFVRVGIRKRDGVNGLPANFSEFNEWEIDGTVSASLSDCLENIQTIIYIDLSGSGGSVGGGTSFTPTDLPTDYGVTLGDVATSNDYNDLDNLPTIPSTLVTSVNNVVSDNSGNINLRNFDLTQWSTDLVAPLSLLDGTALNIFEILSNTDKTTVSATNTGTLDITEDATQDYIQTNWLGTVESLNIRFISQATYRGNQGNLITLRLILRRKSDNSIISVHPLSIEGGVLPENTITTSVTTYVGSATDSFVTDGFYIELANDSGTDIDIEDSLNILIERRYQTSL